MADVRIYIDETGDRGASNRSSPIFGMAAIVVADNYAVELRNAVRQLRRDFRVPDHQVMSWKEHLKTHDRRRRAVEVLGALKHLRVCYVYAQKDRLRPDSYVDNPQRFYHYVASKTFNSALWAARNLHGKSSNVFFRFGHVRHHDHAETERFIRNSANNDGRVPVSLVRSIKWVSADRYLESQAADLYGGFLSAALWPKGEFDYTEATYIKGIWHQIRNSTECAIPLGIMSMPENSILTEEEWFPCASCKHKRNPSTSKGRSTKGGR